MPNSFHSIKVFSNAQNSIKYLNSSRGKKPENLKNQFKESFVNYCWLLRLLSVLKKYSKVHKVWKFFAFFTYSHLNVVISTVLCETNTVPAVQKENLIKVASRIVSNGQYYLRIRIKCNEMVSK